MKQTTLSEEDGVIKGVIKRVITPTQIPPPSADGLLLHGLDSPITSDPVHWHKTHRNLFIYSFDGVQPTRGGKLSRFGRNPRSFSAPIKARFNFPEENCLAFTTKNTIMIWAKHPKGVKTVEQLIEARQRARRVAETMASKHALTNLREREAGFSEHTIEQSNLDKAVRPIVEAEPELAKEKLGLSINQTSHKGKVEWTGPSAKERVMKLELWLDKGQDVMFAEFERINSTLDKLFEALKGPKPPETPQFEGGGMYG